MKNWKFKWLQGNLTPSHTHHFPTHIQSKFWDSHFVLHSWKFRKLGPWGWQPPRAFTARVVSYALGAYKVFIESVVVETSKGLKKYKFFYFITLINQTILRFWLLNITKCILNWQCTFICIFFSKVKIMFWPWEGIGILSPTYVNICSFWVWQ
jgi:hypothetical protein